MSRPQYLIVLKHESKAPIYIQIYQRFREAILGGLLQPGDRVPSLRSLADELGVARGTVEVAYEMLTGEGYFITQGQAGTVIAPLSGKHPILILQHANRPQDTASRRESMAMSVAKPFQLGIPALDAFPLKLWARLGYKILKSATPNELNYPERVGFMPLRKALAGYLNVSRGIACKPSQIIITDSYRGSLNLISRALLTVNDQILMEDPGYFAARNLLAAAGANIIAVPVDQDGMMVNHGIRIAPEAKLALVTPSHQSPLGVTLSLSRRLELLQWAASKQAWIIEDDYDGEYRYASRPLPALKSLDADDRVIYAGSLSKVLAPALRLAYLVVPESQVAHMENICNIFQNGCAWTTQATVAEFIAEGHFARHLKKMRNLYSRRRALLSAALAKSFGQDIQIELQAGGMHLLMRFNQPCDDTALAQQLNANGLAVHALSDWAIEHDCGRGLILSFTNIDSAESAEQAVNKLKTVTDAFFIRCQAPYAPADS